MISAPRTLLTLLALAPFISASNPDNQSPTSIKDIAEQFPTLYLTDFESNTAKGSVIWKETLDNDIKIIVKTLDRELGEIVKQPDKFNSAAALLHGFLEASGDSVDKIVNDIVKTALIARSFNLLRTLSVLYVWSSPEQFHWFQALGYKSEWYDPIVWNDNPVAMDWNKNLHTVFLADNPMLLNDITSGIFSETSIVLNDDALLELVIEHDSLNISQYLDLTLTTHLKTLAESGSFKILRHLHLSEHVELHLEDYRLPRTLPDDFEFFWMQGYRYLPAYYLPKKACECGRKDILEFLYQKDPTFLPPAEDGIFLAITNDHSNVLEWATSKGLVTLSLETSHALLFKGYFKVFEQLQEKSKLSADNIQYLSNATAAQDRLDAVKWLHDKFKVVPEIYPLSLSSIKVLKWIEVVDPQLIDEELASNASLDILKWLSRKYPHLLTDNARRAHNEKLENFEKMQWMLSQGWEASPNLILAVLDGKVETLKFGYINLQMKPANNHATCAAHGGHTKILELIHSIDSSCIDKDALLDAVLMNHFETARYLESILDLNGEEMKFNLSNAFKYGPLEMIEWCYQNYKIDKPEPFLLEYAISGGHLQIINWALENKFILTSDTEYLKTAAQHGQHLIFQRLVDYGMTIVEIEEYVKLAFKFGKLKLLKYLLTKDSKSAQILKDQEITFLNYHVVQWLRDQVFDGNK